MARRVLQAASSLVLAAIIWFLSVHNLFIWALGAVVAVEWPNFRRRPTAAEWLAAMPLLVAGGGAAILVALYPRAITQLAVAAVYAGWRTWLVDEPWRDRHRWLVAMVSQLIVFEGLFLAAAIWQPPRLTILICLWLASFGVAYGLLRSLTERSSAILSAAWALVVVEASWVFLSWLVAYVIAGGYWVVPQPAVVLGGLAYCAGSIYLAGRQGQLSRARLGEYLVITFGLVILVIAGTGWRGTI